MFWISRLKRKSAAHPPTLYFRSGLKAVTLLYKTHFILKREQLLSHFFVRFGSHLGRKCPFSLLVMLLVMTVVDDVV